MNARACYLPARQPQRTLEGIIRRCLATGGSTRHAEHAKSKSNASSATLMSDKINLAGRLKQYPLPSEVHSTLADVYKINGQIPEGKKKWDHHVMRDMPLWGDWGVYLSVRRSSGPRTVHFSNLWLRDNCRCSKCVNQDTMQKAFDTFSLPKNIRPIEVITAKEGLRIKWDHEVHESLYPWNWLMKHSTKPPLNEARDIIPPNEDDTVYWGAEIKGNPPSVSYDEIMADDTGVGKWTGKIRKYGFCYVDGCPAVSPEKTKQLLERISFIRLTHYGGFYDFTSDLTMKDTAYTSLALAAHTDTTYFTDPAGLQMFHLLSHTDGSGGESLLVDGFKAAKTLYHEDRDAFYVLLNTPIPSHASGNEGITIVPSLMQPVLKRNNYQQLEPWRGLQIRWNNDDRGVLPAKFSSYKWYEAARTWNEILKRKDMEYWAQLEPGRPLIFDNWRVLHGRSAFTGKRRICGGYINYDDYISRWRNTNFTREEILNQIL